MYSYIFRFVVTAITILTANLLTNAINTYFITYKSHYKPVTFTLIGMCIIIAVFYPLFLKLEGWVKKVSVKVVRSGSSIAGKYLGLLISFIVCMMVLFYFYAKMWYHLNFFNILFSGNIRGMF